VLIKTELQLNEQVNTPTGVWNASDGPANTRQRTTAATRGDSALESRQCQYLPRDRRH
jgi:hypothetical protein